MRVGLATLALVLAAGVVAAAEVPANDSDTAQAEAAFRAAFEAQTTPDGCFAELERVAKEYPKSPWADDSLWLLGEAARQQDATGAVLRYWHCLISQHPDARLEEYTRSLDLYRNSALAQVERVLMAEGTAFALDPQAPEGVLAMPGGPQGNARRFNALPMIVWDELGNVYEALGLYRLAVRASRSALDRAPPRGRFADLYRRRVLRLERIAEARGITLAEGAVRAPEGTAPQPAGAAPSAAGTGR